MLFIFSKNDFEVKRKNSIAIKFVREVSCLFPSIITTSISCVTKRLVVALEVFIDCNQISLVTVDKTKTEFCAFISSQNIKRKFLNLTVKMTNLNVLYSSLLRNNKD